MNFGNFGNEPLGGSSNGRPRPRPLPLPLPLPLAPGLTRQFDEFQNTLGGSGIGKDLGSMNMDELLKNIWSAEDALSQKKVDDVWKDIAAKEFGSSAPQRQQTLGETTLKEFLFRAGVVKEDAQPQSSFGNPNLNQINMQSTTLPLNVNGLPSSQPRQQPQLMPKQKQPAASYVSTMMLPGNTGIRGGMTGLGDPGMNNNNLIGMAPAATLSSESNGNTCSVSPMPYVFNGGFRGRKSSNAVEKVVERRQRRMIKNRESAARSRARKQAYTMDLEQEIAKLKEENQQLQKKQVEIVEKQINQVQEMTNAQSGPRKRLRRMHTGPW